LIAHLLVKALMALFSLPAFLPFGAMFTNNDSVSKSVEIRDNYEFQRQTDNAQTISECKIACDIFICTRFVAYVGDIEFNCAESWFSSGLQSSIAAVSLSDRCGWLVCDDQLGDGSLGEQRGGPLWESGD